MDVADTTLKEVAAVEPNLTAVAPVRFVPVTVTEVPVGPEGGLTEVTVGAGDPPVLAATISTPTPPETPDGFWVAVGCWALDTLTS
jgi:hypothetical protein